MVNDDRDEYAIALSQASDGILKHTDSTICTTVYIFFYSFLLLSIRYAFANVPNLVNYEDANALLTDY